MDLPVTRAEAMAVARALGRCAAEPVAYSPASHCPALSDGMCQAYDSRPQVCRDFQCNGEEVFSRTEESLVKLKALAMRDDPIFDLRAFLPETIEHVLARHERIAFQFSGGKDSAAALLFLRPYWDHFTVYYCDSGDAMPETTEIVDRFANQVPRFERVAGRVLQTRAELGLPTDVLPWTSAYAAHLMNTGSTPLMQDWVSCCYHSVMLPLHERMIEDGITLIIRGQKSRDSLKGALVSGMIADGIEFLYPVEDWTDDQCFDYVRSHGIEPQRFYAEGLSHSGDCMSCTAWLADSKAKYLRQHHPHALAQYRIDIKAIADAVIPLVDCLKKELKDCEG